MADEQRAEAEFAGIAVGLQLIFGLPLAIAALIGLLGVMLVFVLSAEVCGDSSVR
jgi:Mn2+/Fe2+ NRAMP family transporter